MTTRSRPDPGIAYGVTCYHCMRARPRRPRWGRHYKTILFQIIPGGVFHHALPGRAESLCGRPRSPR